MRIKKETNYQLGILGKVKVGEMSANGKFPTSLDYFRFTSNDAARVERMRALFGEKPIKIPITFHCDDTNIVCIQKYELRDDAGKLVAYGDGQTFFESHKDGFLQKPTMDSRQGEAYMATLQKSVSAKAKWQETLTLRFWVMGYQEIGLWEFNTKGKDTSIGQIIASFDTVMQHAGRVKGMPFWLTVEKHKSNRANANRQYPVVNLVCDLSPEMVEQVGLIGSDIQGLVTPQKLGALPMPETKAVVVQVDNDIEDAEIIMDGGDEFSDEMNSTNDFEPQAEYVATMIVEAPKPEIPTDEELEKALEPKADAKAELVNRLDLEANPAENKKLIDAELWERLVKTFVIAGWNMRQLLDSKWWKDQTIEMSEKEGKRLNELLLLRDQMVLKEMDLAQVQGQNGMTEIEKSAFAELAKKENLK